MIFGRHSVLKRGCSTWDPNQVPAEVFQTRLAAVRDQMARQNLDALVIYGDNYSFADLCYLTNYFPKVRGGIAVVPWAGAALVPGFEISVFFAAFFGAILVSVVSWVLNTMLPDSERRD